MTCNHLYEKTLAKDGISLFYKCTLCGEWAHPFKAMIYRDGRDGQPNVVHFFLEWGLSECVQWLYQESKKGVYLRLLWQAGDPFAYDTSIFDFEDASEGEKRTFFAQYGCTESTP